MAAMRSTSSSPDPLSKSIDRLYPPSSPTKRPLDLTPRRVLRESSPNLFRHSPTPTKSRRTSPVKDANGDDFIPLALARGQSVVLSTPGRRGFGRDGARTGSQGPDGSGGSPLRIRLTVETDDDVDGAAFERTTTVTVPLKGEDEHRPVKRRVRRRQSGVLGSGELQESEGSRLSSQRTSLSRRVKKVKISGNDTEDTLAQISMGTPVEGQGVGDTPSKRSRGRPRKSPAPARILDPASNAVPAIVPKRLNRMDFANLTPLHLKQPVAPSPEDLAPQFTPWEVRRTIGGRAAQKIRNRVPTPKKPVGWVESTSGSLFSSSPDKRGQSSPNNAAVSEADDPFTVPDVDEEVAYDEVDIMSGLEDDTTMLDRSAIESEGFSMVSMDSLRNQRPITKADANVEKESARGEEVCIGQEQADRNMGAEQQLRSPPPSSSTEESMGRPEESLLLVKASPVRANEQDSVEAVPPAQNISLSYDTQLSSTGLLRIESSSGNLSKYIAGMSPLPANEVLKSNENSRSSGKRKSSEAVFDAFGVATKRQLRAGFAMGELLARNEKGFAKAANSMSTGPEHVGYGHLRVTASAAPGSHLRLPTPAESIDSSNSSRHGEGSAYHTDSGQLSSPMKVRRRAHQEFPSSPLASSPVLPSKGAMLVEPSNQSSHNSMDLSNTEKLDIEFQQERDDVIRQIEAANTSQVIVIDSDYPDREEEDIEEHSPLNDETFPRDPDPTADIWQAEADRSLEDIHPSKMHREQRQSPDPIASPTPNFADLFVEDVRPTRAKIPRTWRKVSGNDFRYSDEIESPARAVGPIIEEGQVVRAQDMVSQYRGQRAVRAGDKRDVVQERSPARVMPEGSYAKPLVPANPHENVETDDKAEPKTIPESVYSEGSVNVVQGDDVIDVLLDQERRLNTPVQSNNNAASRAGNEAQSDLENSDVRQLVQELKASAGPKRRSSAFGHKRASTQAKDIRRAKLQPGEGKAYARLFEDLPLQLPPLATQPTKEVKSKTVKALPPGLLGQSNVVEPEPLPTKSDSTQPQVTHGLLSRLKTWLVPLVTQSSPQPLWTRNHYLLLDHYHTLSLSVSLSTSSTPAPSVVVRGPPLPTSYRTPLGHLSTTLTRHMDSILETPHSAKHPQARVTERWLRVVHAFIEEARSRGIPWLCDGRLEGPQGAGADKVTGKRPRGAGEEVASPRPTTTSHVSETEGRRAGDNHRTQPAEMKYPLRGADGRVLREKEEWVGREWEVLKRVYSLWTRDVAVGKVVGAVLEQELVGRDVGRDGAGEVEAPADRVDETLVLEVERRTVEWVTGNAGA